MEDFDANKVNIAEEGAVSFSDEKNMVKERIKSVGRTAGAVIAAPVARYVVIKANKVPEIEEKIMSKSSGGLYHFTGDDTADKIIKSGKIKASDRISSYSLRKKTFFFNNNPEVEDVIYNINDVGKTMTAVKVMPNEHLKEAIDSGKVHFRLDDDAICIVGTVREKDGYDFKKVQMELKEKDGRFYYVETDEQNKEMTDEDKSLDERIDKKLAELVRYENMPNAIRDTLNHPRNARRAMKKFVGSIKNIFSKRKLLNEPAGNINSVGDNGNGTNIAESLKGSTYSDKEMINNLDNIELEGKQKEIEMDNKGEI